MPSREDLGTARLDPPRGPGHPRPLAAGSGPDTEGGARARRAATACPCAWDLALEARGVQAALRISFPCPIVVMGGSNLPEGQELVGMFAYRLVSGHRRVQTGLARTGKEGTVTTAGVLGLNVITGWQ